MDPGEGDGHQRVVLFLVGMGYNTSTSYRGRLPFVLGMVITVAR
jgi:hypothetical protein